jgi:hypothetical protein
MRYLDQYVANSGCIWSALESDAAHGMHVINSCLTGMRWLISTGKPARLYRGTVI